MPKLSLLLWDVGGVLLSNGWDHAARAAAAQHFGMDAEDFERRHQKFDAAFETDRIDGDAYLAATVFHVPRSFTPEAFRDFMRARSTGNAPALAAARTLREEGRYVMAALNNESRELNEYRIRTFHLTDVFDVFFSSCYTGYRKPDPEAYRFALRFTQRDPAESLFLDDRPENIEAAARLGLRTLRVQDPGRLREELALAGVAAG
jgi:putative hydrolase of the HAD superfamily